MGQIINGLPEATRARIVQQAKILNNLKSIMSLPENVRSAIMKEVAESQGQESKFPDFDEKKLNEIVNTIMP